MYYKAVFEQPIEEQLIENINLEISFDEKVGNEIIYFKNHEFEFSRNESGMICEISYYNQCTLTHDIEITFISLLQNLLTDDNSLTLIDSNGTSEFISNDEIEEYL